MLQDAKNLQNEAVTKLVNLIESNTRQKEFVFRAPTGSGKTYMMADFMNRVLGERDDIIFIVSSLSKGGLAGQNHAKFADDYAEIFPNLKPYLINSETANEERLYVPTDYNVYSLPVAKLTKKSKLNRGAMEGFLQEITGPRMLGQLEKKIILIKDECHIATNNIDLLSEKYITKAVDFSATPNLSRGQHPDVEISDADAEQAKLIKTVVWNEDVDDNGDFNLGDALANFTQIKEQYRNLLGVNPCLIIQISNKEKADDELAEIYKSLEQKPELKWMLIVGDKKKCDTNDMMKVKKLPVEQWKKYAKEDTASIDVIIFKLTISEGWDIPRACMLYQVRDTKSKQLDEQVIGRVRRNPRLLDFESLDEEAQKLAMTAWIWGIQAEEGNVQRLVKLVDVSVQENVRIKTTKLRELKQKRDFNIVNFIASEVHERAEATYGRGKSIFDLWRDYSKADNSVQEIINENTTDFNKWQILVGKISEIKEKSSEFVNNYDESMEVGGEVSFPMTSYYTESNYNIGRPTWVWKRTDGAKKFGLDSEAEEKWANILQDLADENNVAKITMSEEDNETNTSFDIDGMKKEYKTQEIMLWGKNFLGNSEIKFEYYMNGKYSSYPDFVMKDTFGRIHIFEVKSMNRSAGINMDDELYREKIKELEKAYKRASELTNQIFYIPIDGRNGWEIMQYIDGKEMPPLDENSFKEFILSGK